MKTNALCAIRHAARVSMAAAALVTCSVGGCRTTNAATAERPPSTASAGEGASAPRAAELKPIVVPPAAVRASDDGPAAVAEVPPRILVMPSGSGYVVLRAGPEQRNGALSWDVLYLAGLDTSELARPDAEEWRGAVARELVAAFGPLADLAGVRRLTVTAMFGKPGATASLHRLPFSRGPSGWHPGDAAEGGIAQVPRVSLQFVRDRAEEASARRVAAAFITDAGRADYDAAWERTSARVKAMMSRTEFARHLSETVRSTDVSDGDVYVSFGAQDRFLPGSTMEAWVARETAAGPAVQALELRLDDDMEWRVSAVVELIPSAVPPA